MEEKKENPILKRFKVFSKGENNPSASLFNAEKEDAELKTDVIYPEDVLVSVLKYNDIFLESKGIGKIYDKYLDDLLRVRFSLDRQSRQEFVNVNARPLHNFQMPADMSNLKEVRT